MKKKSVPAVDSSIYTDDSKSPRLSTFGQFFFHVLTGARGCGKTYEVQSDILSAVDNGLYFVYIRESQIELETALKGGFWDLDLISTDKYKKKNYRVVGNKIIIDDIVVGVGLALSTYGNFRGAMLDIGNKKLTKKQQTELDELVEAEKFIENNMRKIRYLFFDEFIPIRPKMVGEARFSAFKHMLESLFRNRQDMTIKLNGNLWYPNDLFLRELNFDGYLHREYGIRKSYTLETHRPLAVWLHKKPNPKWAEARKNSVVGMIDEGKNKENNMFMSGDFDASHYIPLFRTPYIRRPLFNIVDKYGATVTFWEVLYKKSQSKYYVTEKSNDNTITTYAMNTRHCTNRAKLIPDYAKEMLYKAKDDYVIEYDNAQSYYTFNEMLPARGTIKYGI